MRTIKFRIWNGENSYCSEGFVKANLFNILDSHPEYVQQFTGLLDKFGVEIYEGDIVRTCGFVAKVIFEHGAFIVGYHGGSSTAVRPQLIQNNAIGKANRVEVIGNIYQNPELLTN